jgi:hypothetical protein
VLSENIQCYNYLGSISTLVTLRHLIINLIVTEPLIAVILNWRLDGAVINRPIDNKRKLTLYEKRMYIKFSFHIININIYTYLSLFIPKGIAEASQIILRNANVLPKLLSNEEYCRRDRW